jgi:glutamine synthetase
MVDTLIVPAALKEQQAIALSVRAVTEVSRSADVGEQTARLNAVTQCINELLAKRKDLAAMLARVGAMAEEEHKAHALSSEVLNLMAQIRGASDKIEDLVADEHWPLPKYREMLFIY